MRISDKFSLQDITRSDTATRKGFTEQFEPEQRIIDNATEVCKNILDKIPHQFFISSFYRCRRLNRAIGGSATSDHMEGCSVDIDSQNNLNNRSGNLAMILTQIGFTFHIGKQATGIKYLKQLK